MNLLPLLYVGFRLAPFVIVSFFVLSSMLSTDIRGIIFLGLLLLNCIITFIFGGIIGYFYDGFNRDDPPEDKMAMCNALTIGNGERASMIPLNINIISFTFAYLVYLVGKHKKEMSSIPTIIFFSILILATIFWEVSNQCVSLPKAILALVIGGGIGVGFAEAVDVWGKNIPELQYFSYITNQDTCKQVTNEVFECTVE